MSAEWSRPERLDAIGEGERVVVIEADPVERAALSRRFGLVAIDRLAARLAVRRDAAGIVVTGNVSAQLVQACVITDEPLTTTIEEPIALRFVEDVGVEEDVELCADALDVLEIEGGAIDLGEVAAETMALALDPFPRSANAAAAMKQAGILSEDEAGPFSALAALKDRLNKEI